MIWKCNICNAELKLLNNQPPLFCPNCGHKDQALSENVTQNEDSNTQQTINIPLKSEQQKIICPICCSEIYSNEERKQCPDCNVYYHQECWDENQGCATYGCPSSPTGKSVQNDTTQNVEWKPCPWCHTLLPINTVICSTCGHQTDNIPIGNHIEEKLKEDLKIGLLTIRRKLQLLWQDAKPLILYLLHMYKRAINLYVTFKGEDTRSEFASFVLISFIISLILIIFSNNIKLASLYWISTLLPTIASIVRRLRNAGMSPWYCSAIPILIFLLFAPTEQKDSLSQINEK